MTRMLSAIALVVGVLAPARDSEKIAFPFREDDRVAWIGSSSTNKVKG